MTVTPETIIARWISETGQIPVWLASIQGKSLIAALDAAGVVLVPKEEAKRADRYEEALIVIRDLSVTEEGETVEEVTRIVDANREAAAAVLPPRHGPLPPGMIKTLLESFNKKVPQ